MLARFTRIAIASLGLLSLAGTSHASFSVATMFTGSGSPTTVVTPVSGLTFTANPLMVTSNMMDEVSFNFIQITKSGSLTNVNTTFTINGTFTIVNNGAQSGMGTFAQTFNYILDSTGTGSLNLISSSLPSLVGGIRFGTTQFSSPSVVPLSGAAISRGNLSTTAQQTLAAVPEPASVAMVGLGLAGLGGLALRRRRAA